LIDRICLVLISVLTPSAVDGEFESLSDKTNDYTFGICCLSAETLSIKEQEQTMGGSE
jgi:hypothetical protein